MTDDAINRLVAERVMGWTPHTWHIHGWYQHEGWLRKGPYEREGWLTPQGKRVTTPRVTSDPAAWGALYQYLTTQRGCAVSLYYEDGLNRAMVQPFDSDDSRALAPLPGRALALAALRAYGVEVPDGHP